MGGDCQELKIPGEKGDAIHTFNIKHRSTERGPCYKDFVDVKMYWDMDLSVEDSDRAGFKEIEGIGLISFLGLGKHFVAGGVNQIEQWARDHEPDCAAANKDDKEPNANFNFAECKA